MTTTNLTQHPLSAAFPRMSDDEFQDLQDSIENIGVQNPIVLFEGMVLDGWNRYQAAKALGMDCPAVALGDVDPKDFVMAQNKSRRHITVAQLAIATAQVYQWRANGANQHTEKRVGTQCPPSKTTAELSEISGVGERTIKQAKAVTSTAAPEVIEAVKSGAVGLPKAAAIAKLPQAEQAAALTKPLPKRVIPVVVEDHEANAYPPPKTLAPRRTSWPHKRRQSKLIVKPCNCCWNQTTSWLRQWLKSSA